MNRGNHTRNPPPAGGFRNPPHGPRPNNPRGRPDNPNNPRGGYSRGRPYRGRANTPIRRNEQNNGENMEGNFNRNQESRREQGDRVIRAMGFQFLERLLEQNAEDLVSELHNERRGFQILIKSDLTPDMYVLIVKTLRKVCTSTFTESKAGLLQISFDNLGSKLPTYVLGLQIQSKSDKRRNLHFWNNPDDFWYNLLEVCKETIILIPTSALATLPPLIKAVKVTIPRMELEHNMHISDEIKNAVDDLFVRIEKLEDEEEEKKRKQRENPGATQEEPPDDFRQISVYPTSHEILQESRGFLRENVIKGAYKNVNHYLDVQFRLLREDFVGPLRQGIHNHISKSQKRLENIRIYEKTRFLNAEACNGENCFKVAIIMEGKRRINLENSKRLMFGCLLCFTRDKFKTLIFGKLAEKNATRPQEVEIIVSFDDYVVLNFKSDYVMVECGVYFEPYYHVLTALQKLREDDFPMEHYLINVTNIVQPPRYLINSGSVFRIDKKTVNVLSWPEGGQFYSFNESQNAAFKAALTQEFVVIQGPPGTGKTFLGLKIARTLLKNSEIWYKRSPILVICYTNHALDQFLEGTLETTDSILRIGGQSKNERVNKYNLRSKTRRRDYSVMEKRTEVENCLKELKNISASLQELRSFKHVMKFTAFSGVVEEYPDSWFETATDRDVIEWLLEGKQFTVNSLQGINLEEIFTQMENLNVNEKEQEQNERIFDVFDDDADFFGIKGVSNRDNNLLISLSSMENFVYDLKRQIDRLNAERILDFAQMIERERLGHILLETLNNYNYIKMRLEEGRRFTNKVPRVDLKQPHRMTPADRWILYFTWLYQYMDKMKKDLSELNKMYRKVYKIYNDLRQIDDTRSMKEAKLVGMTTTGAARLRSSIEALHSPIVIVEEAAEVLESHIITSLTSSCQHLILIGDHQQLKPSTADYAVETKFNLGVSLFERMVLNGIKCYTLNVQHRMKPVISRLIKPDIYPDLQDHESVFSRPDINGVQKCLYFIDHQELEEECSDSSKKNTHEAVFLLNLATHLILNGYDPSQVTIVATYLGQMFEMHKIRKSTPRFNMKLNDVRITVLDNYQGEESDIILLSLVRSNEESKIGFLKIENRVCVALSRARNGFYMMGNMTQLSSQSELWQKVKATLQGQDLIGPALPLKCQVHEVITNVSKGEDFNGISEGGCNQICGADLICGHKCNTLCHILDRNHEKYKCLHACNKNLCNDNPFHLCRKLCYEECGPCTYKVSRNLDCGHTVDLECGIPVDQYKCVVPVATILPCGHEAAEKPCFRDPETFPCPHPCETIVEPCGHACSLTCHTRNDPDHIEYKCYKPCAKFRKGCTTKTMDHICRKLCHEDCSPCLIEIRKKKSTCDHVHKINCNEDVEMVKCTKRCKKKLPCGHECKNNCCDPCSICMKKVDKDIPECGHKIKIECYRIPTSQNCSQRCKRLLPCGHSCTNRCKDPCVSNCQEMVECSVMGKCGHKITRAKCGLVHSAYRNLEALTKYCNKPCGVELKCKHECTGTCGECFQGRVHKRCGEKCGVPLVCDHLCTFPCREACRPCVKNCTFRCVHSKCTKKCGDICVKCKELCKRRCAHKRCNDFCGEICKTPPCEEPCPRLLLCGHACAGFCGDPCPNKCLICDEEELRTIKYGNEDEEGARFVQLADCGHIIESTAMVNWLNQADNEIKFKRCPDCKSPIINTLRYKEYTLKAIEDINKVKAILIGSPQENENERKRLQIQLKNIDEKSSVLKVIPSYKEALESLEKRLRETKKDKKHVKQRQTVNKMEITSIEMKIQLLNYITDISIDVLDGDFYEQLEFIISVLFKEQDHTTEQEVADLTCEIQRLVRMAQFVKLKRDVNYEYCVKTYDDMKQIVAEVTILIHHIGQFTNAVDAQCRIALENLKTKMKSSIQITIAERLEITRAMGLTKGHWYKCPNGHPYAIGECGGAMQKGRCPECGAVIGGAHHALAPGNAHDGRMDGSSYAAWSEQANLNNYVL